MTDHITPETDVKLADDPQPSSDSPDYARALEIHIHLLRADAAQLRAALELIAAPMRPDGTYNRDRAACGSIARAALNPPAK